MKPKLITERDRQLFLKLQTYGFLTTRQVQILIFPDTQRTTLLRRLRKLETYELLQRVRGLVSTEHAWALTADSASLMPDHPAKLHFSRHSLDHDVRLTELRLKLEQSGIARSWIPEHEIKSKIASQHGVDAIQKRTIPDGIMSVVSGDAHHSVAVELEISRKSESRYADLFRDYRNKTKISWLWYLVTSHRDGEALLRIWENYKFPTTKATFAYSTINDVLALGEKASIFTRDQSQQVGDLWTTKNAERPAHPPAHGVSTQECSKLSENSIANPSNQTDFPAPHVPQEVSPSPPTPPPQHSCVRGVGAYGQEESRGVREMG